jgi:MFS family permease
MLREVEAGRLTARRRGGAAAPLSRRDRLVVGVLALGALDLGFEQFMIIPILPAVQRAEEATVTATTWLLSGFLLAAVAAVPVLSRLGDMYGRRRLLFFSVGVFAVGSLVCALSDSLPGLIAGRVVQGIGAAVGPLAIGLARDRAPAGRAPMWIGLLIAVAGVGAALGLLLGGVLVEHLSIAAVFWFLFALAAALLLVVWLVPESPVRSGDRPDVAGGGLLTAALLMALLAISQGNHWGWSSIPVVGLLAGSVVTLAVFVVVERSSRAPLIDMRLMAQRSVWSAVLAAFAMGFSLFIAGVTVPQIATLPDSSGYGLGWTFAETGLVLLPGALAIVLGAWTSGALVSRIGARALVACGGAAAAAAYAMLAWNHGSVAWLVGSNVPLGFGIGLAFAAITNLVVSSVDEGRTAVFVSTTAVSRSTGAALGAQVAAAIVLAAGVGAGGFPGEEGFTDAFVLGLVAACVALAATAAMPGRGSDPLRSGSPM